MTLLWILLAVLYFVCLVTLGVRTLRNGHGFLFVIGIFFPILWIVGALIEPAPTARPVT
jgi:hypothetical protein